MSTVQQEPTFMIQRTPHTGSLVEYRWSNMDHVAKPLKLVACILGGKYSQKNVKCLTMSRCVQFLL